MSSSLRILQPRSVSSILGMMMPCSLCVFVWSLLVNVYLLLSRVIDSVPSCQLPLSCQSGSASLLRVLNDNRIDGRQFLYCREFTDDDFLRGYHQAEQEIFGKLDVTSMIDFLVLRLRGAR